MDKEVSSKLLIEVAIAEGMILAANTVEAALAVAAELGIDPIDVVRDAVKIVRAQAATKGVR